MYRFAQGEPLSAEPKNTHRLYNTDINTVGSSCLDVLKGQAAHEFLSVVENPAVLISHSPR